VDTVEQALAVIGGEYGSSRGAGTVEVP
jgi:hypothetical protein